MAMAFGGKVTILEVGEAQFHARGQAEGIDGKGRGTAKAVSTFRMEAVPEGSRVVMQTDLQMNGAIAQFGRSAGVIQAAAATLTEQFAGILKAEVAKATKGESSCDDRTTMPASKPISLKLLLWQILLGAFRSK